MILIGYGTGRCGTKSLASFLNQQEGFNVTHEGVLLSWQPAFTDTEETIKNLVSRDGKVVGDIGFFWIHYIDLILRKYKGSKAINIFRDDEEVIESFWSYMNPETQPNIINNWWKGYPFDSPEQTKDSIAFTIKKYRMLEHEVQKLYPASIYRMKTEDLNNKKELESLLDWIGDSEHKLLSPVHTNKREQILASRNAQNGRPRFNLGRS